MEQTYIKDELSSCLNNKLVVFERYLSVTEQIGNGLAVAGVKELRQLFSQRRQCIKKIHNIDTLIDDALRKMKTGKTRISHEIREVMNHYSERFQMITGSIAALDNKLMAGAKTERDHLKNELLNLRKTRNVTKTYGGKTGYSSRFLDTRN